MILIIVPNLSPRLRGDRRPKNGCFFWKTSKRPCPPPPVPFWKLHCTFFCESSQICANLLKFAIIFFGLEMTPPLFPPFWTFLDAIASPSIYLCQSVGHSEFQIGDCYRIYGACELISKDSCTLDSFCNFCYV